MMTPETMNSIPKRSAIKFSPENGRPNHIITANTTPIKALIARNIFIFPSAFCARSAFMRLLLIANTAKIILTATRVDAGLRRKYNPTATKTAGNIRAVMSFCFWIMRGICATANTINARHNIISTAILK